MDDIKTSSNRSFGTVFFVVFVLIAFYPLINQDEIRKKGKCEELFSSLTKTNNTVILDRCNLSKDERKYWLELNLGKGAIWCLYFNATVEECKWRIKNRMNHFLESLTQHFIGFINHNCFDMLSKNIFL